MNIKFLMFKKKDTTKLHNPSIKAIVSHLQYYLIVVKEGVEKGQELLLFHNNREKKLYFYTHVVFSKKDIGI